MNFDATALIILLLTIVLLLASLFLISGKMTPGASESSPQGAENSRKARTLRAGETLLVAAWFGLATGIFHLFEAAIQRYGRGFFIYAGPQMLWMTPLAYVIIFAGLGAVLAMVRLVKPRLVPSWLPTVCFAWLGVFSLLLPFVQMNRWAAAVLAAGVAVQVMRAMGLRSAAWVSIMWKSGLVVSGGLAVAVLVMRALPAAAERSAVQSLAAARAGDPNVLLVVLDTVRAANLSLYGYARSTTPELARWAKDGTTFDMALSTSPWTLKSHATMFTGLYPSQIRGDFEHPVSPDRPMLAEIFRDRGYVTAGFVANLIYTTSESGLARGFIHYDDYHASARQVLFHSWIAHTPLFRKIVSSRRSPKELLRSVMNPNLEFDQRTFHTTTYESRSAEEITNSFLAWQSAAEDRPFFAFLNYFDAHRPYRDPPPNIPFFSSGQRSGMDRYDGEIAAYDGEIAKYNREIAFIDSELGRLFDELRRRGTLDKTIVIVVADHGEQFGEHGLESHGNSLYLPLLHVPLVLRYPLRVPKNMRIGAPVTLRDLAATVIDLADLESQIHVPGVSLAKHWSVEGGSHQGSTIIAELDRTVRPQPNEPARFGPMRALFDERFHYIRRGDGAEELYDYRTDTAEARNIHDTPEGRKELTRMRALADAIPTH